jgi:colanic acid/amylovoran biosynthesis glycosyltransferase
MAAPRQFLVYRDRIGVASEISFLRRQYIGFTQLSPLWTGRTILPAAAQIGAHHRLGNPLTRRLFRHFSYAPALPPGLAPIIHAQFARGGALAMPLADALDASLVVTLHGGDISKDKNWHHTLLARRWPALLRRTACFIAVSQAIAELATTRGVPSGKLTVLPIGTEIPAAPPPAAPAAHLFIGRFVEKKGIPVLANAIRQLRAQGDTTPVTLIGDGPLRPVLEHLAQTQPHVTLTGWLPPDRLAAHLHTAIALLVPSIVAASGDTEGLPSVIPEAMAQACPVIGSAQGGIAEAIIHNQTGLLVPPNDPAALAHAMHQLATDHALRHRLGQAAYAHTATHLNARIQSQALEALLLAT